MEWKKQLITAQFDCCSAIKCCGGWKLDKCICVPDCEPCPRFDGPYDPHDPSSPDRPPSSCRSKYKLAIYDCDDLQVTYKLKVKKIEDEQLCVFGKLRICNHAGIPLVKVGIVSLVSVTCKIGGISHSYNFPINSSSSNQKAEDIIPIIPPSRGGSGFIYPVCGCVPIDLIVARFRLIDPNFGAGDLEECEFVLETTVLPPPVEARVDPIQAKCCLEYEDVCDGQGVTIKDDTFDPPFCEETYGTKCFDYIVKFDSEDLDPLDPLDCNNNGCWGDWKKVCNVAKLYRGKHCTTDSGKECVIDDCNLITTSKACFSVTKVRPSICAEIEGIRSQEWKLTKTSHPISKCKSKLCDDHSKSKEPLKGENLGSRGGKKVTRKECDFPTNPCRIIKKIDYCLKASKKEDRIQIFYQYKIDWDCLKDYMLPCYSKKFKLKICLFKVHHGEEKLVCCRDPIVIVAPKQIPAHGKGSFDLRDYYDKWFGPNVDSLAGPTKGKIKFILTWKKQTYDLCSDKGIDGKPCGKIICVKEFELKPPKIYITDCLTTLPIHIEPYPVKSWCGGGGDFESGLYDLEIKIDRTNLLIGEIQNNNQVYTIPISIPDYKPKYYLYYTVRIGSNIIDKFKVVNCASLNNVNQSDGINYNNLDQFLVARTEDPIHHTPHPVSFEPKLEPIPELNSNMVQTVCRSSRSSRSEVPVREINPVSNIPTKAYKRQSE